ncbi:RNA methyltransferase substrate-binding domain-containing protein [Dankookia sp. P2]|uniref:RNA methyltransferase substrate-binding domain-containing protein n=1 Tax=Dankookia sp. P2 TaxID=3423955 RepID=UPI003D67BA24
MHGLHPVVAALANPARRLKRLLLTEDAEAAIAAQLPKPWRIAPERVERAHIASFLPEDSVHQGAALLAEPAARPAARARAGTRPWPGAGARPGNRPAQCRRHPALGRRLQRRRRW